MLLVIGGEFTMTVAELWEKVQQMIREESPNARVLAEVGDRLRDINALWVSQVNNK